MYGFELGPSGSGYGGMEDCCEHADEYSGSTEVTNVLVWPNDFLAS
jgi:hypothetical protein